ncbi:MAG: hypothetical protein K0R25_154 [Rickettsiaceae bacterium]|jgi:hypothetical protein|nr:hypothetical protein [Rickettsiaceae bacterium]
MEKQENLKTKQENQANRQARNDALRGLRRAIRNPLEEGAAAAIGTGLDELLFKTSGALRRSEENKQERLEEEQQKLEEEELYKISSMMERGELDRPRTWFIPTSTHALFDVARRGEKENDNENKGKGR